MKSDELKIVADVEKLDDVLEFVNDKLDICGCDIKTKFQIDVALEEMYVNVASYAYKRGDSPANSVEDEYTKIQTSFNEESRRFEIKLIDGGIPFNPLDKPDPDVDELFEEEDSIGGLGIYMVKETMDDVSYERANDENIFSFAKILPEEEA